MPDENMCAGLYPRTLASVWGAEWVVLAGSALTALAWKHTQWGLALEMMCGQRIPPANEVKLHTLTPLRSNGGPLLVPYVCPTRPWVMPQPSWLEWADT